MVGLGVIDGVGVEVPGLAVNVADGVTETDGVIEAVNVRVTLGVLVNEAVRVGVGDGPVGVNVGVGGVPVTVKVKVGAVVGVRVGVEVGIPPSTAPTTK